MRRSFRLAMAGSVCVFLIALQVLVSAAPTGKAPRAKPPATFDKDVTTFFATDAKSHLTGERPAASSAPAPATKGQQMPAAEEVATDTPAAAAAGGGWSALISGDALMAEVKSWQPVLNEHLASLGAFNGGGYRKLRPAFSMMAVSMAIIAEYEGEVRWKDQAPAARDGFAKAGYNLKVASDSSFKEAKLRAEDLAALLRGEDVSAAADAEFSWEKVSARPPLMSRLEAAHKERLSPATSNDADFAKRSEEILHEAQIVAVLAEVIKKEGYEYADDEGYQEYCDNMKAAALELIEAVNTKNGDAARRAVGAMGKACDDCHGDFRA